MKTMPSPAFPQENGAWRSCEGEVDRLVHRLRHRRRSDRVRRSALAASLALLVVAGNYFYSDVVTALSIRATGSPCDHYTQELRAFYCDESCNELETKFWEHVSKCPDCQRELEFCGQIAHSSAVHPRGHSVAKATRPISLDELMKNVPLAASR